MTLPPTTTAATTASDGPGPGNQTLTAFYEDLHAHPELSMREHRTAARLAARLRGAGADIEVTEGVGGTGVVAVLRNGPGPVVMVRADMDALPVTENTGLPYASTEPGVMHACGHDVHLACAAGAVERLSRERETWSGTLLVVGQPGEETAEGARAMLADGLFTRFPRPDVILGQHAGPAPVGTVGHRSGLLMSAALDVEIRVYGRGGHGASPENCVDPVVTAAYLVTRLQALVSREISPREAAVVTVGTIQAGTKANVIPDEARLTLNIRTRNDAVRTRVLDAVRRIAEAECAASGCPRPPRLTVSHDFPVTSNDTATVELVRAAHRETFGAQAVAEYEPLMGSEDFPVFGMAEHNGGPAIPYAYWFLGATPWPVWEAAEGTEPAEKLLTVPGNHTSGFAPDPAVLTVGVTALTTAALACFRTTPGSTTPPS
ncbi:amidohydrolase [Streptomyces sp. NPDC006367]|uniref:amidohydrolase n=1 Tax=unclassified Streptomyces TaxID=2593676 RepID=UPI0033B1E438